MRLSIFLGLILTALFAFSGCEDKPTKPKSARSLGPTIGELAPEIDGDDLDGKYFKLSQFKGKVVLLDFWGMWCGWCVKFLPHGKELTQQYKNRPFVILGVNTDGEATLRNKAKEVTFRSWSDGDMGAITKRWEIKGFPSLYLIDHEGVIRRAFEGFPDTNVLDEAIQELVRKAENKS